MLLLIMKSITIDFQWNTKKKQFKNWLEIKSLFWRMTWDLEKQLQQLYRHLNQDQKRY